MTSADELLNQAIASKREQRAIEVAQRQDREAAQVAPATVLGWDQANQAYLVQDRGGTRLVQSHSTGAVPVGAQALAGRGYVDVLPHTLQERPPEQRRRREPPGKWAILYSVVAGNVREFWLRTEKGDQKLYEIPLITAFTPTTSAGGTGTTVSFSGTFSGFADPNLNFARIRAFLPPNSYFQLTGSLTMTWTGVSTVGQGRSAGFILRLADRDANGGTSIVASTITPSDSGTFGNDFPDNFRVQNQGSGSACVIGGAAIELIFQGSFLPSEISATYSATITIGQYVGPTTMPNNYESWMALSPRGEVFVIVKDGIAQSCTESLTPTFSGSTYERLSLITAQGNNISTATYSQGDEVITRPQNWRKALEDFLPIEDQPESGSPCADDYFPSKDVLLKNSKLYRLDLDQQINGQPLRSLLQSSASITATLEVAALSEDESGCNTGGPQQKQIKLKGIGRTATIEGIAAYV